MFNPLKLKHSSDDSYEETELSFYKRERCDPNVNPLKWWKENGIRYPRLSVLARQYLSIPGTSYRLSAYSQPQDNSSIN
jgi:hypothetical protein